MLAVAGVDPLRRVAEGEIAAADETRGRFQQRRAVLLGRPGIDRRFVDDDVALLERRADGARRREQGAQIGAMRLVDRGGHRDDEEIGRAQIAGVGGEAQIGRAQILGLNLARPVVAAAKLGDTLV